MVDMGCEFTPIPEQFTICRHMVKGGDILAEEFCFVLTGVWNQTHLVLFIV
jgi:hypothetical protein